MFGKDWIEMKEKKPVDGQKVWSYFEITGINKSVYYRADSGVNINGEREPLGFEMDCFDDESGFLCDDVTHWMPYNEGDVKPKKP